MVTLLCPYNGRHSGIEDPESEACLLEPQNGPRKNQLIINIQHQNYY